MYRTTPTHFQWREALFPTSAPAVVGCMYTPGEAGRRGLAYNAVVRVLLSVSWTLNLILLVPMVTVTVLSSVFTFVLSLPVQPLRLFLPPEIFINVTRVVAFPAVVLIHLTTLPVKLVNLLIAVIVYLFGPKT